MTLSRHVDRMEAAGLVERRPDPERPPRPPALHHREEPRAAQRRCAPAPPRSTTQAQAGLSADARVALIAALELIIRNLSAAEAGAANEAADRRRSEKEVA